MMDKDIFSFDRLWKLARFYTPAIRLVLIIFGLLLVFAFWISFTGMSIMKSNPENPFGFLLSSLGNPWQDGATMRAHSCSRSVRGVVLPRFCLPHGSKSRFSCSAGYSWSILLFSPPYGIPL